MRFKGLFPRQGDRDTLMRHISVNLNGLTPEQRELDEFERCYTCTLYEERYSPWHLNYDPRTGDHIPYEYRKPAFVDPLAKEIVDTLTASIFGHDKFPSINVRSKDMAYSDEALREVEALEGDDLAHLKELSPVEQRAEWRRLSNEHLQKYATSLLSPSVLAPAMMEAARFSLIMGRSLVVFRFSDGKLFLEVINYKWVRNLTRDKANPRKVMGFREQYIFETEDPEDPEKTKRFWHRRDFTDKEEIAYHPVEVKQNEIPKFIKDKGNSHEFAFGFCPAVIVEAPQARSIFHGQLENFKNYTYLTNNVLSGINANMNPQWVLMLDSQPTLGNMEVKRKGGIWVFPNGRSMQNLSPSHEGYSSAREFRRELREELLRACRVENDSSNMNYQSGAAIQIRLNASRNAIGEYRLWFGERSLMQLSEMILNAATLLWHRNDSLLDVRGNIMVPFEDIEFEVYLGWGQIQPITEDDVLKAITNALTAYKGGLVDLEKAVRYIAPMMKIDDVDDMVKRLKAREREFAGLGPEEIYALMQQEAAGSRGKTDIKADVAKPERPKLKDMRQGD